MIRDCQEWRKTVEDVGIDELYRRIDPFDVRNYSLPPEFILTQSPVVS
jgi:hypothetical protein